MKTMHLFAGIAGLLIQAAQPVFATSINYSVTNISANTWEYSYQVINDSLASAIEEFTVYFDHNTYANLVAISAPATWDPLVVEPNNFLNNDGFYDALALSSGIAPGGSLGGFTVRFDYLGTGAPGSQYFEIVDASSFAVLDSGQTSLVPVPAAAWLFGSGLIGLFGIARRKPS